MNEMHTAAWKTNSDPKSQNWNKSVALLSQKDRSQIWESRLDCLTTPPNA